jgi:hypothetical protein
MKKMEEKNKEKYILEGFFTEFTNCTCDNYRHGKLVNGEWIIPKCIHQVELDEKRRKKELLEKRKRIIGNLLNEKED